MSSELCKMPERERRRKRSHWDRKGGMYECMDVWMKGWVGGYLYECCGDLCIALNIFLLPSWSLTCQHCILLFACIYICGHGIITDIPRIYTHTHRSTLPVLPCIHPCMNTVTTSLRMTSSSQITSRVLAFFSVTWQVWQSKAYVRYVFVALFVHAACAWVLSCVVWCILCAA